MYNFLFNCTFATYGVQSSANPIVCSTTLLSSNLARKEKSSRHCQECVGHFRERAESGIVERHVFFSGEKVRATFGRMGVAWHGWWGGGGY